MLRLLFTKQGKAIWISHLDLMRALQRSFRRAGLLLKHSQGFTPHPALSIAMPLSVGVSSEYEIAEFELAEPAAVPVVEIAGLLNPVLPQGLHVLRSYEGGMKLRHLKWLNAELELIYDDGCPEEALPAIRALFTQPELRVEKHSKKGPVSVDIQPMHRNTEITRSGENLLRIRSTVSAQEPTLNPLLLAAAVETHLPEYKPDQVRCRRIMFLNEENEPFT